jgi:hypothetical protein
MSMSGSESGVLLNQRRPRKQLGGNARVPIVEPGLVESIFHMRIPVSPNLTQPMGHHSEIMEAASG